MPILNDKIASRVRTIPVIGYWYRAVLASTAKHRYQVSVSSVSLALLLFGPSLIVRLSDKASTAADRPPLSDGNYTYVREGGVGVCSADR